MSVKTEALENLKLAGLFDKDSDYNGMIGDAVMKLVNSHCDEGHSGFSSELALTVFNKVIKGHALTKAYYDKRKSELEKFAMENMGEVLNPKILEEMLGPKP